MIVFVARRMSRFHASGPDSRPPPVSFSPPNAPPISAPLVPMFTLTILQSLPAADMNGSASRTSFVKKRRRQPLRHAVADRERVAEVVVNEHVENRCERLARDDGRCFG
ncbi:hypothetical protein WS71_04210 [Burkholderia mayonis]|uniref:Uncharacterized protein n=1 Tax=Burkholderia mayonis TaxID=1385591 RepID=A0A1B4FSF5_9BURK|nr:hypothetical protein WS71_04210 [Burkholderia mayonis]KVE51165.1 hypothetical protein WS71_12630 [Burkholderia mayonis]